MRDSLTLEPDEAPDTILLDAPCSGSGTWGRHPEAKWRCSPEQVEENGKLQRKLLERAATLLAPGGVLMYSTCSLFRTENEKIVADVMSRHPELVELPVERRAEFMRRGKPYGTVIMPALPWVDGFTWRCLRSAATAPRRWNKWAEYTAGACSSPSSSS